MHPVCRTGVGETPLACGCENYNFKMVYLCYYVFSAFSGVASGNYWKERLWDPKENASKLPSYVEHR